MTNRKTTEMFIQDAIAKHGTRYDYSKVVYKGRETNVTIICKVHGEFEQRPGNHLAGKGCRECAKQSAILPYADFVSKAVAVHGSMYTYNEDSYLGYTKPTRITCPIHGDFWQEAETHARRTCGCPTCAVERRSDTTASFTKKAMSVHGDRYDYTPVNYKGAFHKVDIQCKIHGLFTQTATDHLRGRGCPECGKVLSSKSGWSYTQWENCSKTAKTFHAYKVYVIVCNNTTESFIKVGRTFQTIAHRFRTTIRMPYAYSIAHEIIGEAPFICTLEQQLHTAVHDYRVIPEIPFDGMYECFSIEALDIISTLIEDMHETDRTTNSLPRG
jgi:hypothetical protein